jgi:hypothetical protein
MAELSDLAPPPFFQEEDLEPFFAFVGALWGTLRLHNGAGKSSSSCERPARIFNRSRGKSMRCLYGAEMYVQYGGRVELLVLAFIDAEPPFGEALQPNGALEISLSGAEKPTPTCYACGSSTHETPRSFDCSEHKCATCHGELEPTGHNDKNCPLAQCDAQSQENIEFRLDVLLLQGTGSVEGALEW